MGKSSHQILVSHCNRTTIKLYLPNSMCMEMWFRLKSCPSNNSFRNYIHAVVTINNKLANFILTFNVSKIHVHFYSLPYARVNKNILHGTNLGVIISPFFNILSLFRHLI